ncbi:MAG: NRDE family protein [Planctomycetales bacterium]
MCLLGLAFQSFPETPILVLANREEALARPSQEPQWHPIGAGPRGWAGGLDLLAGGTWLGVNSDRLLIAVTNRRKSNIPPQPRSRGSLCRSLLECRTASAAVTAAMDALKRDPFAGCNLLFADPQSAAIVEWTETLQLTHLNPGTHWITNGILNDPLDKRIARARAELERARPPAPQEWMQTAARIAALGPDTGQPAICLEGGDRGTVSSSIIGVGIGGTPSYFWHAPGPPARTAFVDQSLLLARLDPAAPPLSAIHRIQLRGPWRLELIADESLSRPEDQSLAAAPSQDSTPRTVRMPAEWGALVGNRGGGVSLRRRFHRPSGLGPHEQVYIILEGVLGRGEVWVNHHPLGAIDELSRSFAADVTSRLTGNDELRIDLEIPAASADVSRSPVWSCAALEIRADAAPT